jgi:hypothetical protein
VENFDETPVDHNGVKIPLPGRENFSTQGLNQWLDTPGGRALKMVTGGRQQAAAALAADAAEAQTWRQDKARAARERYPGRWRTFDDALFDVPDAQAGSLSVFSGTADELVAASRWADPTWKIRNLGDDLPDSKVNGIVVGPGSAPEPVNTANPWDR